MGIQRDIYEFAARAGAFEGYVYERKGLDPASLKEWVDHLARGYASLPPEARSEFQSLLDGTIGRAIQSLLPMIGEEDEIIKKLRRLTAGEIPSSPDDFTRAP
jgi:hypothetical protein